MKGHDRGPEPSMVPLCPACGAPRTPHPGLLAARHDVTHAEWELAHLPISQATLWTRLIDAYRALVVELDQVRTGLNARICDLEESLASAEWDRKVAYEAADDFKRELDEAIGRTGT